LKYKAGMQNTFHTNNYA